MDQYQKQAKNALGRRVEKVLSLKIVNLSFELVV